MLKVVSNAYNVVVIGVLLGLLEGIERIQIEHIWVFDRENTYKVYAWVFDRENTYRVYTWIFD